MRAVPIDDERRQQIGFGVHQPVRVGVEPEGLAEPERSL
jgi:hypothetical protein